MTMVITHTRNLERLAQLPPPPPLPRSRLPRPRSHPPPPRQRRLRPGHGQTEVRTPLAPFVGFGWILPILELAIGLLLIAGLWTRQALTAGALLVIALMLGVTLRQDWPAAGLQLTYSFLFSLLLFLRRDYDLSWPGLLRR